MIVLGVDESLPEGWAWAQAQEVMDVRDGTHDSPKPVVDGVPLVTSKNLVDGKIDFSTCSFISEIDHEAISKRSAVDVGDILYAMIGTIGNPVIVEESCEFSIKNVALFKFKDGSVWNRYIYHFLNSNLAKEQFKRKSRGGTQKFVSLGNIRELEIPLPPLAEQKRIAAILDKAYAIRRKRQQAIQLADEFLRSVFLDMFGDPVTNPKGWMVEKVGDVCACIVPGRDKPKSFTGSVPWVTTNELTHLGKTCKKDQFIGLTEEEISEVKAKVIPVNSVLMTCVGDLGVVSIAGEEMVINQQLHAFLPSELVTQFFLAYSLSFQKAYMLKMASNTTVPYMNKTVCNSVPIILPPRALQEKFEAVVAKVKGIDSQMKNYLEEPVFESLSQKAFSGQL